MGWVLAEGLELSSSSDWGFILRATLGLTLAQPNLARLTALVVWDHAGTNKFKNRIFAPI